MRTLLRIRWTGPFGRVLFLAVAAVVAVVLLLPATASSKRARTRFICPPTPRPDGPIFPKQGPPGSSVMFHGSKMSSTAIVEFKGKGGLISAPYDYEGKGWITATVPDNAVTGPIVISSNSSSCTEVMLQKFTVTPS